MCRPRQVHGCLALLACLHGLDGSCAIPSILARIGTAYHLQPSDRMVDIAGFESNWWKNGPWPHSHHELNVWTHISWPHRRFSHNPSQVFCGWRKSRSFVSWVNNRALNSNTAWYRWERWPWYIYTYCSYTGCWQIYKKTKYSLSKSQISYTSSKTRGYC